MNNLLLSDIAKYAARIADALERQNDLLEGGDAPFGVPSPYRLFEETSGQEPPRHLSLFLENLPTRNYEHLRLKLIPAGVAADILGISPKELAWLDAHAFIKSENGLYDVLSILMWLDSDENPDTGGAYVQ